MVLVHCLLWQAAGTPDEAADDPPSEGEVAMEGRGRPVDAHQPTSALPVEVGRRDVVARRDSCEGGDEASSIQCSDFR